MTLPHNDFLPKEAPPEKLELIVHHEQLAAEEEACRRIVEETGLAREEIGHCWTVREGVSRCVFTARKVTAHCPPGPGISVLIG